MNLDKVLFIGGNPKERPSVQIRCLDIASALGCNLILDAKTIDNIPKGYSTFICVKPGLHWKDIAKLARRGLVIWDVLDVRPPKEGVSIYLVSTHTARQYFPNSSRIEVIPHHHCNKDGTPNNYDPYKRAVWIGSRPRWYPHLQGFEHEVFDVEGKNQDEIVSLYHRIGIGLNFRADNPNPRVRLHVRLNSGIKLINCIGFGIPSISCDEPAYKEWGDGCTIYSDVEDCGYWVQRLQTDDKLYLQMKANCMIKARQLHISIIAEKYRNFLLSL